MSDLAYTPATEALRMFRTGELSPVDLLDAVIARAEQIEPTVNALGHTFYDEARSQAEQAAERWARGGDSARPLEGIPVAVKADDSIAGQPFTMGSLPMRDVVAEHTSVFARRLIEAGAIVHARTTIPEFAAAGITSSKLWGVTRNPWNPRYAVGGSSGGSAAALAAGTTTLATGSDIAGSIRIPASMCGVVGYKPTRGTIPIESPANLDHYLHLGSMARTVDDVALMQSVTAGPDWSDPASLWPRVSAPDAGQVSQLRIAVSTDLGDWPVTPEVRASLARTTEVLRAAGATVEKVDLSLPMERVLRAATIHYAMSFGEFHQYLDAHPGEISAPLIANVTAHTKRAEGGSLPEAQEIEGELWLALSAVLRDYDMLLCPTMGSTEILADLDYAGEDAVEIGGRRWFDLLEVALTVPFNVLGACPVMSVPSGHDSNGVPIGVQLVGRPYEERAIFAAARAIERRDGWYAAPDARPGAGS